MCFINEYAQDQGKIFAEIKLENTTKSQVYIKSVDMIPVEELEVVPLEVRAMSHFKSLN